MTAVSTTGIRKTSSSKNLPYPVSSVRTMRRTTISTLQVSLICNIVLSCFVMMLLYQQSSLITFQEGDEFPSSKVKGTTRMRIMLNNHTSVSDVYTGSSMMQRDYVFHGGHPVTSKLQGSCYCSGMDMYCMCNPSLAIDIVILSGPDHLWFVRRKDTNQLAIVGGFVDIGETVLDAVYRELQEETGLTIHGHNQSTSSLPQHTEPVFFGIYSDPRRDNRRHTVSAAFAIHFDGTELPVASDDVKNVERIHISNVDQLTLFADQKTVVQDYLRLYYDTKPKTSADFITSYDDFAPDIQRSVCIPFPST